MISRIIGTGSYLGEESIPNTTLEEFLDTNDTWIEERTGIKHRYFTKNTSDYLAYKASLKALESIDKETIDMIIVGSYTSDHLIPTTANLVKERLGITRDIPCFDINAACSGFIFAYANAHSFITSQMYKRILVIGVDKNSKILDFTDRSTAILFGDGAGAVVVEGSMDKGCKSIILKSVDDVENTIVSENNKESNNPMWKQDYSAKYFTMKGRDVFKFALNAGKKIIQEICETSNITTKEIDLFLIHQANQRIIEGIARAIKEPILKFPMNIENYGNTSSASIPILLDELVRDGKIVEGMKIAMVAFGGGLSVGALYFEW